MTASQTANILEVTPAPPTASERRYQRGQEKIVTVGSGGKRTEYEPPRGRFNPLVVETLNGVTTSTGDMSAAKAAFWSKPSCRRCHGRGLETISWPNGRERISACSCVLKNMATR